MNQHVKAYVVIIKLFINKNIEKKRLKQDSLIKLNKNFLMKK